MADQHPPSRSKVAAVVSFYMVAAMVMIFVNKAVLNSSPNLPLLMLLMQFLIAVLCLHASALVTARIELPKGMLSWERVKKLAPILVVNVFGLTFNTLCLRDVDASFFQIARGMVLPLTIAASAVATRNNPSTYVLLAAAIVTVGFLIGVAPTSLIHVKPASSSSMVSSSVVGLVYGGLSSIMTALHAVLIKASLPHVDNSAIQLAYWTNASAALILAPFVLITGEAGTVWKGMGYGPLLGSTMTGMLAEAPVVTPWDWKTFLGGCVVTGVVGFLLCVAGLLSIKITSPVTHMFSSAMRSVLQTLLGIWIFSDILTTNRVLSIGTIMGGTMYYTWVKSKEAEKLESLRSQEARDTEVEAGPLMMKERTGTILFEAYDQDESDGDDEKAQV